MENHSLSEKNESLSDKVDSLKQQDISTAKKPISKYSKSHQRRLKRKQKSSCEISLEWLKDRGLIPVQLTVRNVDTGDEETIDMNTEEVKAIFGENFEDEDFDMVNMMLMIKDTYQVSGNAYHEFARASKQMPRHFRLKRRIAELNSLWKISPTPDGSGVQQSLEDRLRDRLTSLVRTTPDDSQFKKDKRVRIKLSGDGTYIDKRLHVVNFTFTILDEGKRAFSGEGNYCLAIIREEESYEGMKTALADICEEVERLHSIEVDEQKFDLVFYLGGDWKYLALVTGKFAVYY